MDLALTFVLLSVATVAGFYHGGLWLGVVALFSLMGWTVSICEQTDCGGEDES